MRSDADTFQPRKEAGEEQGQVIVLGAEQAEQLSQMQ